MPVGTSVIDIDTEELIADLETADERVMVAKGGFHGLGNTRFKSSTNRAPRQTTEGSLGEMRTLQLQLRLVADVGLLGLPNAGKSTLIRSVSAARPKVADYPFTTLVPNLGVVSLGLERSFVMADIPGLIEGASEGAGLGFRFLKHLSRTQLLVHLIDALPIDGSDPASNAAAIVEELQNFSPTLAQKERWLVVNKIDLLQPSDREALVRELCDKLSWDGEILAISAFNREGCDQLCARLMDSIEAHRARIKTDEAYLELHREREQAMAFEIRRSIENSHARRRGKSEEKLELDDWYDME